MNNLHKSIFVLFIVSLLSSAFFLISCQKQDQLEEGRVTLRFSKDTILFDTLFTTIGSSTYTLIVNNPADKKVNLSSVYLAGGSNSQFRMNVDGYSGHSIQDVEIQANDSIYVFVEVTIDPNSTNTPMLVTDSIIFEVNGYQQDVDLVAYGRDAYFILPNRFRDGLPPYRIIAGEHVDTTWTNDKPIVVYGFAVVDSTATLRIEEGTEIYFHSNSGLWIYIGGSLKVMGTKDNPVVFQGDRPEAFYADLPGQWDRIWINEGSVDNEINYAIIKNGFIGIQAEVMAGEPGMNNSNYIKNTVIENMSYAGIMSRAHRIDAENLSISNCKQNNLLLTLGGSYEFRHSTFANYWSYDIRKTPAVYINNYFKNSDDQIIPFDLVKANFINCIIYGNNSEELILDNHNQGGAFNYLFDHNLVRTEQAVSDVNHWISVIKNKRPEFENERDNDLHLTDESAALERGKAGVTPSLDLDGIMRDATAPDLGAFEYVP